jgi:hypothetical protein
VQRWLDGTRKKEGELMATQQAPARTQGLGLASIVFGILGGTFYWWFPFGTVLSLAGLIIGLFGWLITPFRARNHGFMVAGTLLSLAALCVDIWIAANGLETVRFTALR